MEGEPVKPAQMNIYQSDTYRKDLSWLWAKGSREEAGEGSTYSFL